MSNFVSGLVFKARLDTANRKLVMLKLADHAHDDGTHIFPSVESIARQTHLSPRTVQRMLSDLVDDGLLRVTGNAYGGRGKAKNYAINMDVLTRLTLSENGDILSPLNPERVTRGRERVTDGAVKGDTACHPNLKEPSGNSARARESDKSAHATGAVPRQADAEGWFKWLPQKVGGPVILDVSSEEFHAWSGWLREVRGKGAPSANGKWWFPCKWPPGHAKHVAPVNGKVIGVGDE